MPEELHQRIAALSNELGVSLNTAINMAVEEFCKNGRLDELEKRISELENVKIPILDDKIDRVQEQLSRHERNYED
jgi:uncharacterized small protein (DUF1192 family)